jgi:hypothetical protein
MTAAMPSASAALASMFSTPRMIVVVPVIGRVVVVIPISPIVFVAIPSPVIPAGTIPNIRIVVVGLGLIIIIWPPHLDLNSCK